MELNIERIEASIIEDAVDRLIREDELSSRVSDMLKARIDNIFNRRVTEEIESAIQKAIDNGFDHDYQKVDNWGKPVGGPTTLRKELDRQVASYWQTKVNRQGQPDTTYNNKYTRAEYIMLQMMHRDLDVELSKVVVNIAGTAKDTLRGALHGHINQLLSTAFSVKSLDDQEMAKSGLPAPMPK